VGGEHGSQGGEHGSQGREHGSLSGEGGLVGGEPKSQGGEHGLQWSEGGSVSGEDGWAGSPCVRVTEHDAHVADERWVKELATMPRPPAPIPGYDEVKDEMM
jgi:hypothetical protein